MVSLKCPGCKGEAVAPILYGKPLMNEELERRLENREVYLGGCCLSEHAPEYHCFACGMDFSVPAGPEEPAFAVTEYLHTVQYYETDKMGITHHSNYIRWMEEARVDFLNQIGWPYEKLEEMGVFSPVTAVECKYKAPTTFPDPIRIRVSVEAFDGLRLRFRYEMRKEERLVLEAHSEHCFLDAKGRILRLQRDYPELYDLLTKLASEDKSEADTR